MNINPKALTLVNSFQTSTWNKKTPKTAPRIWAMSCALYWVVAANVVVAQTSSPEPLQALRDVSGETGGVVFRTVSSPVIDVSIVGPEELVLQTDVKPYSWPDGTMGIIKSGANYRFFALRGATG